MSTRVLDCLRNDPEIADLFWELCEFGAIEENPPDWFAMASGNPLQVVGKDACGGRFCLLPAVGNAPWQVLYVDSEGQAGVIGDSLADAIRMMIALPYWSDCLKFSGGGKLHEMKKAQASFEKDLHERHPDIESSRGRLYRAFGLSAMESPLEVLHRVVTKGASTRVIGTADGWVLDGLFGRFVVEDIPRGLQ